MILQLTILNIAATVLDGPGSMGSWLDNDRQWLIHMIVGSIDLMVTFNSLAAYSITLLNMEHW